MPDSDRLMGSMLAGAVPGLLWSGFMPEPLARVGPLLTVIGMIGGAIVSIWRARHA